MPALARSFMPRLLGVAVLAAGLLLAPTASRARSTPPPPRAEGKVTATCKVYLISGRSEKGAFPRELEHLKTHLKAQPFRVFQSFSFLKLIPLPVIEGQAAKRALEGPYHLELELKEQLLTGRDTRRLRFVLTLEQREARQTRSKQLLRTTLLVDRGGTLFLAGPPHAGGKLVIGLTCE